MTPRVIGPQKQVDRTQNNKMRLADTDVHAMPVSVKRELDVVGHWKMIFLNLGYIPSAQCSSLDFEFPDSEHLR